MRSIAMIDSRREVGIYSFYVYLNDQMLKVLFKLIGLI